MTDPEPTCQEKTRADNVPLGTLLDALPMAAYACDADGRIVHFNESAAQLWGRRPRLDDPAERYCGSHAQRSTDDTAIAHDMSWMALALRDGRPYENREIVVVRPDGSRRNALAYARPLRDEAGRLIGATNVLVDVTEREQMQRALRQRERELQDFFDDGAIPMHWIDANGVILRANRAELDMLGYEAEEYVGQPMAKFHADEYAVEDIPRRLRAGETLRNYEARLIAKDGSLRDVLITANVYREGGQLKYTRCFTVDVTAEKAARAALQVSEADFRGFFDSVSIGATQVAAGGRFLRVNDRYCEITGYTREELLEMCPYDLDHPDDREADVERVRRFVENPSSLYRAEKRYVRKDGRIAWVHVTANLLRGENGQPLHTAAVVEDISERKRAEQALKQADRLKDEFLATLAHELRNPLAPLQSVSELLRLRGTSEQQRRWCHELIERQVEHLTRLIDDLLDISRIQNDKLEITKQRISLADVLDAAIEASRPLLERCGQELVVTAPSGPLHLDGDLIRLTQAFTNLLNNAAKFSDAPGTIRLISARDGDMLGVSVEDSGVGLSPEELPRVFDKFYQAPHRDGGPVGGLGIGLSLVRRVIELHEGEIEAGSPGPGRGSKFIVRLPAAAAAAPLAAEDETRPAPASAAQGKRVLVVDDNRDAADALARLLQLLGHEVTTTYDGRAALERAETHGSDVILLDLGMPALDGFEVCRRLRAQHWATPPHIVAVTGWGRDEDLERTRDAGFDAHLVKPVDRAALERILEQPRDELDRVSRHA